MIKEKYKIKNLQTEELGVEQGDDVNRILRLVEALNCIRDGDKRIYIYETIIK
jgi:hypothetical protein